MRTGRDEWAKRVARWKDSGLTAKEFATELGINPRSLVFWKWQLGKGSGPATESSASVKSGRAPARTLPLIELGQSAAPVPFELELGGGRRLAIPSAFDADALRRLLAVLESAS